MSELINELSPNEQDIISVLRKAAKGNNDVELRNKNDGTYKICILKREWISR